ncbi:hypothetical protein CFC21_043207 [Triticum aestivum]|uniref:Ubiquitin-like protease family profile domain-containing protein n=3 Tax=Triticum TaxID=4564 RepID=A0A9R1S6C9_TRITD|nr:hypothetical protein CFC21_043207 [Triticum aestivum]VAH82732.1 unnamed protein product [Triticum turgidum subsp. durum]
MLLKNRSKILKNSSGLSGTWLFFRYKKFVIVTIMQYIYWEKVEPIGVDTFDPLSREYPLMVNWPETEGKKRDDYDNMHGRGTGNLENCVSQEYGRAKVAREGTVPDEEMKKPKRKGGGRSRKPSTSGVSSNTTNSMDRVMTYIKLLHKEVLNIPERCAQMVMEKLNTEGVLYKPNKRDSNDEFVNVRQGVGMKNGQYKSSKYWPDIDSPTDVELVTSFTCFNDMDVPVDDTGAPTTTPGKGDATDPFIIHDNEKYPCSSSTVRTKEFPSMSRTPQNADISDESMGGLSPTKSEDMSESFPAKSNIGNGEGSQDNEDLFASSPYSILESTLNMTPDHIEAARVFVETLASTKKHAHRTMVDMPPPDGDICTPAMLHDVLKFKWLNGAIINAYCKHLQHRDFSDHFISTTWFPKFMLGRARGKTKSINDLESEQVTKKAKVVARVMDEYFRRDKAYFPMHVNDNHWITIVIHTVKEEFQVLDSNSKGAISQRIRNMIGTLRAEISKDIMEANSILESKKFPDVSSWPINEYKMLAQHDGVSCGLFVMWCIKYWDGDRWTHEFNQQEINESRPRIVAEIIFLRSTD